MHEIGEQHHQQQQQQQQQTSAQLMTGAIQESCGVLCCGRLLQKRGDGLLQAVSSQVQQVQCSQSPACKWCCAPRLLSEGRIHDAPEDPDDRQAKQAQTHGDEQARKRRMIGWLTRPSRTRVSYEGSVRCETNVPDRRHVPRRWGLEWEVLLVEVVGDRRRQKQKNYYFISS